MPARSRRGLNRAGSSTVQFALVVPVFMSMIAICSECARMSLLRNLTQNAAYEGARTAMMEGTSAEVGIAAAEEIIGRCGASGATVTIVGVTNGVVDPNFDEAQEVRCSISIPLQQNTLILPVGDIVLTSQSTLRTDRYNGFFDSSLIDPDE